MRYSLCQYCRIFFRWKCNLIFWICYVKLLHWVCFLSILNFFKKRIMFQIYCSELHLLIKITEPTIFLIQLRDLLKFLTSCCVQIFWWHICSQFLRKDDACIQFLHVRSWIFPPLTGSLNWKNNCFLFSAKDLLISYFVRCLFLHAFN